MGLLPRPPAPASLVVDLARIVGASNVSSLEADRIAYARDAWTRDWMFAEEGRFAAAPSAVVWPESPQDVSRVLVLLRSLGVPVVPYGAGSGQVGAARAPDGGVVLDVKRMAAVRSFEPDDLRVEVEAGMLGSRLEGWLNRRNLTVGHRPGSLAFSTVGGWVATRSAGQLSTGYGKIEDILYGLEVVTPGHLRRQQGGPRPIDGPDANGLILGSEGALGVVTAAELRLRPLPAGRRRIAYVFPNLEAGLEAVRRLLRAHIRPAGFRLFNRLQTVMVRSFLEGEIQRLDRWAALFSDRRNAGRGLWGGQELGSLERLSEGLVRRAARGLMSAPRLFNRGLRALPHEALLVMAFEGVPAEVEAQVRDADSLFSREGGHREPEGLAERWFQSGHGFVFDLTRWSRAGMFVDGFDVSTTWDRVLPLYRSVQRSLAREAVVMADFAHGRAEGCAINFTFAALLHDPHRPTSGLDRYDRVWRSALNACHEAGGSCSHHCGMGPARQTALLREVGPGGMRVLSSAKRAFDPTGLLNPGKFPSEATRPPFEVSGTRAELPDEIRRAVGERNMTRSGGRTIVRPPDEGSLAALLRTAAPRGTPVFCDQTGFRPPARAVQLDLSRLANVRRMSEYSLFVEVEAGVLVGRLEELLRTHGLTLGPVHPRAMNRSVGAGVARNLLVRRGTCFGELSDICFGFRALLPDGSAVERRSVPETAAGPRLEQLFIGGHGRMGILTKLTLRVAIRSEHRAEMTFGFNDLEAGTTAARRILQRGVRPAAARLVETPAGWRLAVLILSPSAELKEAAAAVVSGAVSASRGRRILDADVSAEGGRFDVVVECAQRWSRTVAGAEAMKNAGSREVWLDFMTPDGVTLVARLRSNADRSAVVDAGLTAGGRIVAGSRSRVPLDAQSFVVAAGTGPGEPTPGPYEDVLARMVRDLDPTALLADRDD
ncbi:MAG: FAD-binding oxidoreductase [Myxococcota bacterium]